MGKRRRRKTKRLVEQNLPWRIRNVILAADHVRVKTHLTADSVGEDDLAIFWNSEANRRPLAGRDSPGHFLGCEVSTPAGIARGTSRRERFLALRVELLAGTETVVGVIAG